MFTFSQGNRNRICTTAAKMLFATNYNMPQYKIITYNYCAETSSPDPQTFNLFELFSKQALSPTGLLSINIQY